MWTNSMLKENARAALKGFYWKAVLVTLIVTLLTGGFNNSSASGSSSSMSNLMDSYFSDNSDYNYNFDDDFDGDFEKYFEEYFNEEFDEYGDYDSYDYDSESDERAGELLAFLAAFMVIMGVVILIVSIVALAFQTFVSNIVRVGQNRFYLEARLGNAAIGNVFHNFKNGAYLRTVGTMFILNLKVFLWSLLFIVPGIIKTYEYFLVPFIIADNPQIDRKRAFEISKQTMNGEKANCFFLGLSFIGWMILGSLAVIGTLFVMPYYNATMTEFYCCMKQKAISSGIASSYEFEGESGFFGQTGGFSANTYPAGGQAYGQPYGQSSQPYGQPNGGQFYGQTGQTGYTPTSGMPSQGSGMTQYNPISDVPNNTATDSSDSQRFGSSYMDEIGTGIGENEDDDYKGPEL